MQDRTPSNTNNTDGNKLYDIYNVANADAYKEFVV